MWSKLPFDLLANIFSYLSPYSLSQAMAVCHQWHESGMFSVPLHRQRHRHMPPWFIALPTRSSSSRLSCFIHNPVEEKWHFISSSFIPSPARPIATVGIGGLILFRVMSNSSPLQLAICNPFTAQFRHLPLLQIPRTNPAVGLVELRPSHHYKLYVAGGMSEVACGAAASYEPTLEMYDSCLDKWSVIGSVPIELAVRLTVWTPNESVYSASGGVLYWMTSARTYSIMGFEMDTQRWRELSVPMGDKLEFAALVPRNGKVTLVGGTSNGDVCIWELGENDEWGMIEKVPIELGRRLLGGNGNRSNTKCVGIEGAVCLYRDIGSGMVVWREIAGKGVQEWCWIEGFCSNRGKHLQHFSVKGMFLYPNLAPSSFF